MMERVLEKRELAERIQWLIHGRWCAAGGVLVLTWLTSGVLDVLPRPLPLYLIGIFIALYNAGFLLYARKLPLRENATRLEGRFAHVQISVDLFVLSVLLHFSGGVESPFICYFVFHVIISSILLTVRATYLQATFAVFLFSLLVALEYAHILPHYPLKEFAAPDLFERGKYILGILFVLSTTLYLSTFMATSITRKLRQREYELVEAEESLKARTQALGEANERLREADKLKSEYVLKVTHELRSPLSTIESCLRVVTEGYAPPEKWEEMLKRAVQRTDSLLALINDLLNLSRMKARKLSMEPLNLCELIGQAVDFMRPLAEEKRILIETALPCGLERIEESCRPAHGESVGAASSCRLGEIHANRDSIERLLTNLVGNAIRYTTVGGKITIELREEEDALRLLVSDTGIGIREQDLPRVFDEFYRSENAKAYHKTGTGLGLSLAKQIVESHGGKIWVESSMGKGTTFRVDLPTSPKQDSAA
ncbi:MAG: HAMP domain-containing sensor histidine kinase [Candidatus Latescibacterota bacterium]